MVSKISLARVSSTRFSLFNATRERKKEKKKFFHFSMKEPFQEAEAKAVGKRKEEKRKELKAAKRRRSK